MINKLKKALDNQESIKSTIIMYGENDFFEEEVFILGDNPLICIPKDELKYLTEQTNICTKGKDHGGAFLLLHGLFL